MLLANYLFFTTACEAALAFYTHCGLGKVTEIKRYDVDGVGAPTPAMRGKIMHARSEQLAPLYPKLPEFQELGRSYDPDGKFRNQFVDLHVFG